MWRGLNLSWQISVVAVMVRSDNRNIPTDGMLPTRGLPRTRLHAMVLNQRDRIQCHMRSDAYFPCSLAHTSGRRSPKRPNSVHKLRPGDIQVVANLGDSLSAGTGAMARSALQIAVEYRGVAWSGGGLGSWKDYVTLPNILKNFNPKLYGYSTQNTIIPKMQNEDVFNVADSGATSGDLPKQAKRLIQLMRQDQKVNYAYDWKMVTIMIGGNDVCSNICSSLSNKKDPRDASPAGFIRNIQRTLDILKLDLPRTFVNLVPPPDIAILLDIYDRPLTCRKFHNYVCPCLYDEKLQDRKTATQVRTILNGYLRGMEKLLASGRYYSSRDDFTVVLQPVLIQTRLPMASPRPGGKPQPDLSYLAPDCFHFAQKLHAAAARGLWNNLLEPVGSKTASVGIDGPFLCPTEENPYIATIKNSRKRVHQMQSLARDYLDTMARMARAGPIECAL